MSENTPTDEPTVDEPADRSLTWWPLLAAAIVAAVFLTIILTVGSDGDSGPGTERDDSGALTCPKTYDKPAKMIFWVPSDASGVDGKKSLVPDTKPSHVTVCTYTTGSAIKADRAKLQGSRTLTDGLRAMTRTLSKAPEETMGAFGAVRARQTVYLVGFTFATGYVWVTLSDGTPGATNGEFFTSADLFDRVAQSYTTRVWK